MFDVNDTEQLAVAIDGLFTRSEIFKEYLRGYHDENEFENHVELIRETAVRVAGGDEVDDDILERALYLLIKSGRIKPKKTAAAPLEETPVDTRPRDKNGRLLSAAQIQWGEFTRWANEHSSEDCRKRAQTDEAFKQFMQTRLRQEMNAPIDGAVTTDKPKTTAGPELSAFAEAYNKAPVASLKPINGVVTLNGQKYQKGAFNALVDTASAARLIF